MTSSGVIRISLRNRLYAIAISTQLVTLLPFLRSSWSGDDWPNSQTPYWIMWQYGNQTFSRVINEALFWNNQWIHGNGRFYPLAFIESRLFFSYFRAQWQYKLLQIFLLELALLLFSFWIWKISRNHVASLAFIFCSTFLLQGRLDFDPHLGFSMLLPSLLIKITLASLALVYASNTKKRSKRLALSLMSSISLILAMCTYEYAFLLFPMLVLSLVTSNPSNTREAFSNIHKNIYLLLGPIIAWCGYAIFVFGFIRPKATAIAGAYVLKVSWKSIPTFIINLTAGIPGISFAKNIFEQPPTGLLLGGLLLFILGVFFLATGLSKNILRSRKGKRSYNFVLILVSLLFTVAPSFMLAIQETWWTHISLGHSYLGVMIQEFGLGLLLASYFEQKYELRNTSLEKIRN